MTNSIDNKLLKHVLKVAKSKTHTAKWAAAVDFTIPANNHRFFLINLKTGKVSYSWYTSHGSGSGNRDGTNLKFSNVSMSRKSSLGLYRCSETYYSYKFKGLSLRLDGLEDGINSNARKRAIVMHPSHYVSQPYMSKNEFPGRSWGCVTLDYSKSDEIVNKLKNGSILYIHSNRL